MEFAVVVGPLVKLLPKLLSVVDEKRNQVKGLEVDAGFISRDFQSIQDIIGRSRSRSITDLWIRDLRRLADDMEDCIDSFHAGKTTKIRFATKVSKLRKRSRDTLEQLQNCMSISAPPAADLPVAVDTKGPEEELVALVRNHSGEGKLKVITVAGFGGLGMTRLAHKLYSDSQVRNEFLLHAWVSASGMDVHSVLQGIHDQVERGNIPQVNGDAEHGGSSSHNDRLRRLLRTGRYLIVIDDVNTQELYDVLCAFSWADGVDGRIIMTTSIQLPVATCCRCGTGSPLAMDSTSQVFIGEMTECGLVEACLHLRDDTLKRMERSNNEMLSGPIVQDLLLYFCMFPRDHPVRRNPLIRRWLAEGFLFPQKETESLSSFHHDVAAENLEILINRNIIQPIQVQNYEKVTRCQTSGMMLNSISDKSKLQNFVTMVCGQTTKITQPSDVRRLSLHLNGMLDGPFHLPKDLLRLHTLAVFPDANVVRREANLDYAKYKLLRVLDLKEFADLKRGHVRKICHLVLLKYLSLGDSIDEVPRKITKLKWLETLDMRRTQVVMLPIEVLQLPRLKHLVGKFQLVKGDRTKKKLEGLLSEESEIQRLSGFVSCNSEGFGQLMSRLGKLRKVKIWCDSNSDVSKLTHLFENLEKFICEGQKNTRMDRSLSIDFQGCPAECLEKIMDSLQATGRLTSLKLRGKLARLPKFESIYIEDLCLSRTNLDGDTILAGLSQLRIRLKYLKLVEDKIGHLVIGPEHFKSLKGLCLVGEQSLGDITIQATAVPYLVSLHLLCEDLGDLPGIKITHMERLKEVALHFGVQGTIKDEWQAAAMDHRNRPNVLFIHPANSRNQDAPPCGTNSTIANSNLPMGTRIVSSMKSIFSRTRQGS